MPARSGDLEKLVALVDPALVREQLRLLHAVPPGPPIRLGGDGKIVLVGHRAAGKSTLLRPLAAHFGMPAIDLDEEIARRAGEPVASLMARSPPAFRALERSTFLSLPSRTVVAAGGGFLSLHGDLLAGHLAVLVPVTFATYRARLLADSQRPRLRPAMTVDEEITSVFEEREAMHVDVRTVPLVELLARGVK